MLAQLFYRNTTTPARRSSGGGILGAVSVSSASKPDPHLLRSKTPRLPPLYALRTDVTSSISVRPEEQPVRLKMYHNSSHQNPSHQNSSHQNTSHHNSSIQDAVPNDGIMLGDSVKIRQPCTSPILPESAVAVEVNRQPSARDRAS